MQIFQHQHQVGSHIWKMKYKLQAFTHSCLKHAIGILWPETTVDFSTILEWPISVVEAHYQERTVMYVGAAMQYTSHRGSLVGPSRFYTSFGSHSISS